MHLAELDRIAEQTTRSLRSVDGLRTVLALLALMLVPSLATAAPITYNFTSGTVTLRAILDDGTVTSVLSGPSPVSVLLGGTSVTFDPDGGINGSLIDFELVPASVLNLDLDEALVGLDTISVLNARLVNDTSTQSFVSPTGQFFVNTIITGDVSGFLPGGVPFGPESVTSIDSEVTGSLGIAGDSITFNLTGINIARFAQLPGPGPDVLVKADFTFVGVVPEPGTALLIGLGLAGLASSRRRNAA